MAPFSESDQDQSSLDYCILRDGGVALYRAPEILIEDMNWLSNNKYQLYSLDCQRWISDDAMHSEWKSALSFPDYYGHNLNALNDCLSDLPVPIVGGIALVLRRFDAYSKGAGAFAMPSGCSEAEVVLDILAHTSRYFLLTGHRFFTLVQTGDPTANYGRLGGASAQWNRREWLNKSRGL